MIIDGSDLGGVAATGTLDLTEVVGVFDATGALTVLDSLAFDQITNGGFTVGDTLDEQGAGTANFIVRAYRYNEPTFIAGQGTLYGLAGGGQSWTDADIFDINGGITSVGSANGVEVDNSSLFTTAVTTAVMAVPGTANTNNSIIIHYDGGNVRDVTNSLVLPQDCLVSDATTNAQGVVQRVYGNSAITGSIRLIDSDTTGGAWTNNNVLRVDNCVFYDGLVGGKVFADRDVVVGTVSATTGRVVGIIDDGDSTGKIILAGQTGSGFVDADVLQVEGVTIANVEDTTNKFLDYADLELATEGIIDLQREVEQGGIYDSTVGSINIVRSANAFLTLIQNDFKISAQMDDTMPMTNDAVLNQLYIINDTDNWHIMDKSFRFIEEGTFKNESGNDQWVNFNSFKTSTLADVGAHGFNYSTTNPTPQPQLYLEQDLKKIALWWLEGHIDIIVKVKTKTDVRYIDDTVNGLGQLIDSNKVIIHAREYLRTFATVEIVEIGVIAPVSLKTKNDENNNTATNRFAYDNGVGTPFLVGEEITSTTSSTLVIGIVTVAGSGATGNVDYVLKTTTDFANNDAVTGRTSGDTCDVNITLTNLVAGYGTDIRFMTVTDEITGGTITTSGFIRGELVTQASTGATGYFIDISDADAFYVEKVNATVFSGNNNITGATGVFTVTAGVYDADQRDFLADLGDGSGEELYTGALSGNITGASAQTILNVYEWSKFLERDISTTIIGGSGNLTGKEGRFYQTIDPNFFESPELAATFALKDNPIGDFAAPKMQASQGIFIEKTDLASADLQNFLLINNLGTTRTPPNLQSLTVGTLTAGYEVFVARSTTSGGVFQRTEFQVGVIGSGNNQSADNTILYTAQDRSVSPLPNDIPDTGILLIQDPDPLDTGRYLQFLYNAVNRTTNIFTLTSGTIGDVTNSLDLILADNSHVGFISESAAGASVSATIQFLANIFAVGNVREVGKKPKKIQGTFISTGLIIDGSLDDYPVVDLP